MPSALCPLENRRIRVLFLSNRIGRSVTAKASTSRFKENFLARFYLRSTEWVTWGGTCRWSLTITNFPVACGEWPATDKRCDHSHNSGVSRISKRLRGSRIIGGRILDLTSVSLGG